MKPSAPADSGGVSVRLRLTVAFNGSAYTGWQTQKIGLGVQQRLEEAFARLFPEPVSVQSSSRTDTGVHALGMVTHADIQHRHLRLPLRKLRLALNAHLPEDIRVITVTKVSPDFHARFSAQGKQYRYFVWNDAAMNPLLRGFAWHVPKRLSLRAMRQAAALFPGERDFRSFAANRGYAFDSTIRRLDRCDIRRRGPLITFIIEGNGFLYRMCRGIVGTLVQVGLGRIAPEQIHDMLVQRDRRVAGMSAPACGLTLWSVRYPKRRSTSVPIHPAALFSSP